MYWNPDSVIGFGDVPGLTLTWDVLKYLTIICYYITSHD